MSAESPGVEPRRSDPGDSMNLSTDCTTKYFAVISLRDDSLRERLIIAYPDEKSLRALIAAPSILALGYRSRAEALTYREEVSPVASPLPRDANAALSGRMTRRVTETPAGWATKGRGDLPATGKKFRYLLQYTLAVAIGLIYSQNLVSATLRALVSL